MTRHKPLKRSGMSRKPDRKLAEWSRQVRERDGNQCLFPRVEATFLGPCKGRIDPHHIAPRGRRPDKKYDVDNGICLCRLHHNWVHDNPIHGGILGLLSSETYEAVRRQIRWIKS